MKNSFIDFLGAFRKTLLIWILIIAFVIIGVYFGVPKKVLGGVIITVGWVTGAFAGLMTMLALVPLVGPIIVSVLSLPVIWLLNGFNANLKNTRIGLSITKATQALDLKCAFRF